MITSLLTSAVAALGSPLTVLRRDRDAKRRQRNEESEKRTIPSVEVLEDRCLLSAAIMPTQAEIPFLITLSDALEATAPKGNPTVVFLGDSISYQYAYGTGAPVWGAYMAPLGMADYGISGQTTQSLLFQLTQGQLIGIDPAVVVLDIGANDLLQGSSPLATAAGVLTDVATIHQFLPQSQVIVLGILPGMQSPTNPYRAEGTQTNQLVSQMLAGDPHATFLDLGSIFLQPDGTISTSMMFDYVHPTEQGYIDLTDALLPVIEQALFSSPSSSTGSAELSLPSISLSLSPADMAFLTTLGMSTLSPPASPLPITPS
ncbi:MAG TPA: GDSL-type esterase/lipase family protein [Gemmataceae bacterium]|nr:GDSL-type esterase/lipase family protein [Gemmataceae bacterium]